MEQATFEQGIHYPQLYSEYKEWQQELEFEQSEIAFFNKMLSHFLTDGKKIDLSKAEQFQNKLILHNEQNEFFLHDLKRQIKKLEDFVETHEKNIEFITFSNPVELRSKMETHKLLYRELKQEFYLNLNK